MSKSVGGEERGTHSKNQSESSINHMEAWAVENQDLFKESQVIYLTSQSRWIGGVIGMETGILFSLLSGFFVISLMSRHNYEYIDSVSWATQHWTC